ncbi:MAG: penicillin-binding protein 2, partial [Pseudomonadota bacterium]|nr:penicillin-binding protein 2 [Pseudomonadota bacterium]
MIARRRQSVSRGKVSLVTGMERAAQIARSRLLFAAVVFAVGFVVMAARVVDVAILTDGNEPRLARMPAAAPLATGRADIVDRNGVLLATSLRAASLYADPTEIIDPAAAAAQLTGVLTDLKPAHIAAKLVQPKRFVWIKRHLTPTETFTVNRLGIPGLHFQTEERRVYPHGALAAHVTGFAGVDDTGLAGLEKALDSRIRGDQTPVRTSIDVRLQ